MTAAASSGTTDAAPQASPPRWHRPLASVVGLIVLGFARFITAVRGRWDGIAPLDEKRVYFVNHASHGDFILVWAVMPPRMRQRLRPVAGSDYWLKSALRRFIGRSVFDAVLIDRDRTTRTEDPIRQMADGLDGGASLIVFPEGTRNTTEARLLPFKSGLYYLAKARPGIDLVPTWIDNLNRVLPKGEFIPLPLICTVTFGAPLRLAEGEAKRPFLARAEAALLALAPKPPAH